MGGLCWGIHSESCDYKFLGTREDLAAGAWQQEKLDLAWAIDLGEKCSKLQNGTLKSHSGAWEQQKLDLAWR